MITTLVGRTFLEAYNQKYNQSFSAKEFFEKIYFELFFNHPKYMQWITNSPFVQGITTDDNGIYGKEVGKGKISKMEDFKKNLSEAINKFGRDRVSTKTEKSKGIIKAILINDSMQRGERLNTFHLNISKGVRDGSIAIGYPASEEENYGTYSGSITDIRIDTTAEDVYLSWIGSGLGIGVAGAITILLQHPDILLLIFEGWQIYRKYLNEPTLKKLRGNQINSWNGQWLTYKLGKSFTANFTFSDLEQEKIFKVGTDLLEVDTVNWSNLFFSLSFKYPNLILNSYVCNLSDKNQTLGFIPIYLKAGKRLKDIFKQLYHTEAPFNSKDFQSLFGMHIKRACELGNIGLYALRPENLKKYMEDAKNISIKNEEQLLIYQSYKTWLLAMISKNKEQITDYTLDLAALILRYRNNAKGTTGKNLIEKDLFGEKSKRVFIDALTAMIPTLEGADLEALKKLKDEVHLMTNEEFGYFSTLLKFDYAFTEKQS